MIVDPAFGGGGGGEWGGQQHVLKRRAELTNITFIKHRKCGALHQSQGLLSMIADSDHAE